MASPTAESSSFSSPSAKPSDDLPHGVPKDWKFWCIIFSLALSILLTAIEFVSHPFFVATSPPNKAPERNIYIHRFVDFHRRGAANDHPQFEGRAIHMGRFCLCVRFECPCTSLWRTITGPFLLFCEFPSCYLRLQIIGRRPIMLSAIILFALGSTISGAASSMNMLIAGRGLSSSCASRLRGACSNSG